MAVSFAALGGWSGVLARLVNGEPLTSEEAFCAFDIVLKGEATEAQVAAFAIALRTKGETVDEIVGLVRALFAHAEALEIDGDPLDVVGTGGDRLGSINVSTLAALIAAGAGARVCKHGNRGASSSVGTADVLEALGVVADLAPQGVAACISEAGMGFCFAPRFHPGYRHAAGVRRQLGVPTVFNFLGPLANPAHVRRQLVGVSDPSMAEKMARVLGATGSVRAMVLYADDGLDELSVTAPSTIVDLIGDGTDFELSTRRLDSLDLGFSRSTLSELSGGDAAFNAAAIRAVLEGKTGPHRDIGVLNAAAALVVAGRVDDMAHGVEAACQALDSGAAARVLAALACASVAEAARVVGLK
ncbi:MAG: anthranilate phosphoribosyltransferase [Acidimicrobiales bacterium]